MPEPVDKKLKAVVHYICASCKDTNKLGATKLNKVLFHVDLAAYIQSGKSVSGSAYVKRQHGPCPKDILPVLNELEREKKIAISHSRFFNYDKKDFVSLEDPEIDLLDKDDIVLINTVIDYVCDTHTATSISEETHNIVWHAANIGEEIPMSAFLVAQPAALTQADKDWANKLLSGVLSNVAA